MLIPFIVLIVVIIGIALFLGFAAKKEKKGSGLGDPDAGNQPGPR